MPCWVRKMIIQGPTGLEPPTGARIRKKLIIKIRGVGGGIFAPRAQHGRVPIILIMKSR